MSSSSDEENALDLSNACRGLWIVKIPKSISDEWEKAASDEDVGTLHVSNVPGEKKQVSLTLATSALKLDSKEGSKKYVLDVCDVSKENLAVFSQPVENSNSEKNSSDGTSSTEGGELCMEGKIVSKFELRPVIDAHYKKLKEESLLKIRATQRQTQQLDKIVPKFKPIMDHQHNIEYKKQKKLEGKKWCEDRNKVEKMLCNAFEKHQYYKFKDLVKITKQPVVYLREILREIGDYRTKKPHRYMWQLKKQYSDYRSNKSPTADEAKPQDSDDSD